MRVQKKLWSEILGLTQLPYGQVSQDKISPALRKIQFLITSIYIKATKCNKLNSLRGIHRAQSHCQETIGSSLFGHFKIIQISKKQNAYRGIRTRNGVTKGLGVLHYAIMLLDIGLFYQFIYILSMTGNVIYFTIYDKLI